MNTLDPGILAEEVALQSQDGHAYTLIARIPATPSSALLWVPALGVAARHYLPFAEALAALGYQLPAAINRRVEPQLMNAVNELPLSVQRQLASVLPGLLGLWLSQEPRLARAAEERTRYSAANSGKR